MNLSVWKDNPVFINELRMRMRGKRAFIILGVYVLLISIMIMMIYSVVYEDSQSYNNYYYGGAYQRALETSATLGKSIFYGTELMFLFILSFAAPSFSAGAIVGEKERQTFELLSITTLPGRQVVLGKLVAIFIFLSLLILATMPFYAMAFFFGGVEVLEIVIAIAILLLTAILFSSLGMFVSSFARSTTLANMISYFVVVPLLLGVPFFSMFVGIVGSTSVFFDDPPFLVATVMVYGGLFFLSINPLSMALLSQLFLQETGNYLFSMESMAGYDFPLISPWIIYVLFALAMIAALVKGAIVQVERVSNV